LLKVVNVNRCLHNSDSFSSQRFGNLTSLL
jgi:hypothetical protein